MHLPLGIEQREIAAQGPLTFELAGIELEEISDGLGVARHRGLAAGQTMGCFLARTQPDQVIQAGQTERIKHDLRSMALVDGARPFRSKGPKLRICPGPFGTARNKAMGAPARTSR